MVHRKSFDGKLGKTTSSYELNIRNNIGGMIISNSKCEKRLDINIDNKQTFESHVRSLCKNASQKLNTFAGIAYFLKSEQKKLGLNVFIKSQFSYALLLWMFHN